MPSSRWPMTGRPHPMPSSRWPMTGKPHPTPSRRNSVGRSVDALEKPLVLVRLEPRKRVELVEEPAQVPGRIPPIDREDRQDVRHLARGSLPAILLVEHGADDGERGRRGADTDSLRGRLDPALE